MFWSKQALFNLGKSLAKVIALFALLVVLTMNELSTMLSYSRMEVNLSIAHLSGILLQFMILSESQRKQSPRAKSVADNEHEIIQGLNRIADRASLFEREQNPSSTPIILPNTGRSPKKTNDPAINQLHSELKEIKELLVSKQNHESQALFQQDLQQEIDTYKALPQEKEIRRQHLRWTEQFLASRDFSTNFSNAFLEIIQNQPEILVDKNLIREELRNYLTTQLPAHDLNLDNYQYDTIALCGASGVGKSTALAKMAAHIAFTRKKSFRFVSVDRYKIRGESLLEKLSVYMKAPFYTVNNKEEFLSLLSNKECDYSFVDFPGKGPKEQTAIEEFASWIQSLEDMGNNTIDTQLVLSSCTSNSSLSVVLDSYRSFNIRHFLLTKLDQGRYFGSALSTLWKEQKPFSFFADGQEVPQDFCLANTKTLIQKTLESD